MPFHSPKCVRLVKKFASYLKPTGIVGNGDLVDCFSVSRFEKDPRVKTTLARERRTAAELWSSLPRTKQRYWMCGNHEDRVHRYIIEHAQQFVPFGTSADEALERIKFRNLFQTDKMGVDWKEANSGVFLGKLYVTHGVHALQHSAYSARKHYDKFGCSVLHGHSHRLGAYYKTDLGGPKAAFENGCLCSMKQPGDYTKGLPNWQHGFSVVHVDAGGMFSVQQIPILAQHFCYFGGKRFEV